MTLLPIDDLLDQTVLYDSFLPGKHLLRYAALRLKLGLDDAQPVLAKLVRLRGKAYLEHSESLFFRDYPRVHASFRLLELAL